MEPRPGRLRKWVIAGYGAVGAFLVPWTAYLAIGLPRTHVTHHWDLAWTGFDVGLAAAFGGTAFAAWRRSPWLHAFAAATGTLLLVDAWFDVVLESRVDELRWAIMTAIFAELPAAAFCFYLAYRTERFLEQVVQAIGGFDAASHLATAREGASEGDLVGVLEVAPDGEPAGEARHPDAAA
jgi:hypothetical protein